MRVRFPARTRRSFVALGVLAVVGLGACGGKPKYEQTTLDPNGPNARGSLDLLTPFFWIAVVIGIGVLAATVWVALRYRYREGSNENPVQVHGNTKLEITWTVLPALILVVMAVFTVAEIFAQSKTPAADDRIDVTVIGRQWWWQYEYNEPDYRFYTANEMHIPEGRPVYLTIDATDMTTTAEGGDDKANVNHSFWIPNLSGKKDVIPGRIHHLTIEADPGTAKPGEPRTFLGQCAEYCGLAHADMRLRVIVHTPEDYAKWVEQQLAAVPALTTANGEPASEAAGLITQYGCTGCHSVDANQPMPAKGDSPAVAGDTGIGPNLAKLGDRQTIAGAKIELNEAGPEQALENLTNWIWDAPSYKPMACNHPYTEAATADPACVGMPSFKDGGMPREDAQKIAQYLLDNNK